MLNLYKLEIFSIAVKQGSFSRAASQMLLTQSAVSQHIQDLERYLGTKLFVRGPRGVTLTPAGETLYDYTQQILALIGEAENAVIDVTNLASASVTIGATPGVNIYLLPEWIGEFRERFHNITPIVQTGVTGQIIDGLLDHTIDIGFVEGELEDYDGQQLRWIALQEIELFVIIGRGHHCWDRQVAPTAALNGQAFVARQQGSHTRAWFEDVLRQHEIRPRIVAEFDNQESIKHAVASGMGITILPEYAVRQEINAGILRAVPIEGVPLKRILKLVWDNERPFSPVARAFTNTLAPQFPQLTQL